MRSHGPPIADVGPRRGRRHGRPFLDLQDPRDAAKLGPLAEELHSLVLDMGGTVSAQHGTGLARTPWVARQYGPLHAVFRELKAIFDPRQIFNPGKIVGPGSETLHWPLRAAARAQAGTDAERPATSGDQITNGSDAAIPKTDSIPFAPALNWRGS